MTSSEDNIEELFANHNDEDHNDPDAQNEDDDA